jgi:hypothetical protein
VFSIDSLLNGGDGYHEVWDNQTGGTVVRRYQEDGVKYVDVEFSHSPGKIYTYLAKETNG